MECGIDIFTKIEILPNEWIVITQKQKNPKTDERTEAKIKFDWDALRYLISASGCKPVPPQVNSDASSTGSRIEVTADGKLRAILKAE